MAGIMSGLMTLPHPRHVGCIVYQAALIYTRQLKGRCQRSTTLHARGEPRILFNIGKYMYHGALTIALPTYNYVLIECKF